MNPKDLLDDMYEVLIAIKKTGAFADLQDWNQELADELVKVTDRYKEMKRLNPHD
jgi:NTP pyrophosphatase (non-canonical NTP hydrolase)